MLSPSSSTYSRALPYYGDSSTAQLLPIVSDGMSDSGNLDAVVELLVSASHRTLPEAVTLCVPESQTWHDGAPTGVGRMDLTADDAAVQVRLLARD